LNEYIEGWNDESSNKVGEGEVGTKGIDAFNLSLKLQGKTAKKGK
jgi:hypothetical protein